MKNYSLPVAKGISHQDFSVYLDGAVFTIELFWNERDSHWYMSLFDAVGGAVVTGVTVVADWDLLRTVATSNRPAGQLIAVDMTGGGDPTFESFGTDVLLMYRGVE